ncbi:uncharacterized protein LOC144103928 isoform X5 [Amblyomma americanum]
MPQWYMPTAIPLAIVCVLSSSLLDPAGTCNTRLPPFGPRLFRAKVLFGEAMRLCSKELLAVAKTIPPHKLNKLLPGLGDFTTMCHARTRSGARSAPLYTGRAAVLEQTTELSGPDVSQAASEWSSLCWGGA